MHRRAVWAALLLAALLAGCERGSLTPAPNGDASGLTFAQPSADDNVFEIGRAVPVRVRAPSSDGAAHPVQLLADGAGVSLTPLLPEADATRALVSGSQAGPIHLRASQDGDEPAVRTVYLRPAPSPLGLLVPAYFEPDRWLAMAAALRRHPQLAMVAIVNPDDGHFDTAEPELVAALARFTAAGGRVIGYVETRYGKGRPTLDAVRANIDDYVTHYGAAISGFFIDEVPDEPRRIGFFEAVRAHIRARYPQRIIVGNPGTFPAADYTAVADTLVTFEGTAADYLRMDPQPDHAWIYNQENRANAALIHDASCAVMQQVVRRAAGARNNTGWVYATDLHYDYASDTGDPWADLPSYWDRLVDTLAAVNQGRAPPPC